MAYISTTYTFSNGAVADASQVNQNYTDIISGLSDGTKDLNMNAATFAGNLTANGNIVLGNASSDTLAFTGAITLGANSTLTAAVGAFATPSINFTSSTTTGLSCAAADTLIISTAATARITISSTGLVTLSGTMDLVGGQIKFPATQSASADANTLDDYEENTWTPTLGGNTTYTKQLGNYTKIGRHVYFSCIVHVNAIGTGSATTVSGLPFAAAAGDVTYAINVGYWTGTVNSYVYLAGEINAGASNFVFYGATTAATALSVPVNVFQNSTLVRVSGHYIV